MIVKKAASNRSNRHRGLVGGLIAVGLGGAFWLGSQVSFAGTGGVPASARPSIITTHVVAEILTSTLTIPGTIEPQVRYPVGFAGFSIPNAQDIVTNTPPVPGAAIATGSILGSVSGASIIAMPGRTPMYRDLKIGDTGTDVLQLQSALASLGYEIADRPGKLGPSTALSYWRFLISRGVTPAQYDGSTPSKIDVPYWQIIFLSNLPAVVVSDNLRIGQAPPDPALVLDAGTLAFQGRLTGAQRATIVKGDPVQVTLPGGQSYQGFVASIQGTLMFVGPFLHPALPPSSARSHAVANVTIVSTKVRVLAVPASALSTLADGRIGVRVLKGNVLRDVPVQVGVSVGGMVSVTSTSDALRVGDLVVVSG